MSSGVKFTVGAAVVAAAIGYLAFLGAAQSWQYYLSVDELIADETSLEGQRLRISGRVDAGSLSIDDDRQQASFVLAGQHGKLHVVCRCLVPDNVAEKMEVVVEGQLQNDVLHGNKLITRCASKYEAADHSEKGADLPRESGRRPGSEIQRQKSTGQMVAQEQG